MGKWLVTANSRNVLAQIGFFILLIPEKNAMSEESLVAHCSPVLAGLKTANMFNVECSDAQSLCLQLRDLNLRLGPKGVRILPLRFSSSRALLYLYRPSRLQKDLQDETAVEILKNYGYPQNSKSGCLGHLFRRLPRHGCGRTGRRRVRSDVRSLQG